MKSFRTTSICLVAKLLVQGSKQSATQVEDFCRATIVLWVLKQVTQEPLDIVGLPLAKKDQKKLVTVVFGGRSTTTRNAQMRKLRDLGFKKASAVMIQ